MKVSVLVPVYKTNPDYLREAIESVLNQSYKDFELIVLDDCPEDARESIVSEYADDRIKYFKNQKNLGISKSRNKLIDLAQGEYLAIFDHDDICHLDRLEKEVKYLDEHPECGVVGSWMHRIPVNKTLVCPESDYDIKTTMLHYCCVWHSTTMIRRSVLEHCYVRYNELFTPAEDYGLFVQLMAFTDFYNIQEALIDYREHENNTSRIHLDRMLKSAQLIKMWAKDNLKLEYNNYLLQTKREIKIGFLGIKLLRIYKTEDETNVYIFRKIKLLSIRNKNLCTK